MRNDTHDRHERHDRHDRTQGRGELASLRETDDYKVADGYPDIKGWDVKGSGGRKIGSVHDLLFDRASGSVRYMDVELDRQRFSLRENRHVLIPIGGARLDDDGDNVLLGNITDEDLLTGPSYQHRRLNADDERAIGTRFQGRTGGRDLHDERGFWGRRHQEGRQALVRSEEELAIGTRRRQAGEVEVQKRTTTEHVQQEVPVTREEVTVERRPVSGDTPVQATSGQDEIRVPVYEEEIVTEKRRVPKEEVVIRTQATQGSETVEADLEKEQIDIETKGRVRRRDTRDARAPRDSRGNPRPPELGR